MVLDEKLDRKITFESFGVRIRLESNNAEILGHSQAIAERALLGHLEFIDNCSDNDCRIFGVGVSENDVLHLYRDGQKLIESAVVADFFRYFDSMIRIAVAEYAKDRVFVHAGVVGWKGRAVIIPASSHTGKTTLVAQLIGRGATYFSDEYAILDKQGMVHPFPRSLTIRNPNDSNLQTSVPFDNFGNNVGKEPAAVGAVLLTEYLKGGHWEPEILGLGQGILETVPHAISLHADTKLSLELLNMAFGRAIIAKSKRGDANSEAAKILAFLDKHFD